MNYYNENDPYAADWLRGLINRSLIPFGDVDERSIVDVDPQSIKGYTQHHFFAGIGGWSRALQLSGWPEDRPVWTGSCPCQPFSVAGKRAGTSDSRHLWPVFCNLIKECKPATVFGEQVASKDGRKWLSGVRSDLEALGYAVGAADLCAASAGAPHIRQRLFWMADSFKLGSHAAKPLAGASELLYGEPFAKDGCEAGGLGDTIKPRLEGLAGNGDNRSKPGRLSAKQDRPTAKTGGSGGLGDTEGGKVGVPGQSWEQPGSGFWSDYDTIYCADEKTRRIEPGTFPLAHGVPARVGRLRAFGNAIVPQVAAEFVIASQLGGDENGF